MVSEEIFLSVLVKCNIWWSSEQVRWCVSGFWLKAQIQNEALQAIYHSKSNRKIGKVFSGSSSPSSCTHKLFHTAVEVSDAAILGQNRNRRLLSHLREGDCQGYGLKQSKILLASLKKRFCSGIMFMLILNLICKIILNIIFITFLANW